MTQLEERLDAIESKNDITDVINQYTHAFDRQDRALLKSLWWDDATFSLGEIGGPFTGPEAILEGAEGLWAVNPVMHHWMANVVIALDGDRATVRSAVDVMVANGEEGPVQVGGLYQDVVTRREGVWKFSSREFIVDYWTPLKEWHPTLGEEKDKILATVK